MNAAWAFAEQLRQQDYVAMMTFDLNTHIVSDFTQDKKQIQEGIDVLGTECTCRPRSARPTFSTR